jgi:hypothetical protein
MVIFEFGINFPLKQQTEKTRLPRPTRAGTGASSPEWQIKQKHFWRTTLVVPARAEALSKLPHQWFFNPGPFLKNNPWSVAAYNSSRPHSCMFIIKSDLFSGGFDISRQKSRSPIGHCSLLFGCKWYFVAYRNSEYRDGKGLTARCRRNRIQRFF